MFSKRIKKLFKENIVYKHWVFNGIFKTYQMSTLDMRDEDHVEYTKKYNENALLGIGHLYMANSTSQKQDELSVSI
jgi:hypothetical protein